MPKTVIEKIPLSNSGVTVFKIGGTLGFHEKETLTKLLNECEKRGITKIIMDFSELTSLGGGCAKIIQEKADAGKLIIGVAGASKTSLEFLQNKDRPSNIHFTTTVKKALAEIDGDSAENMVLEKTAAGGSNTSSPPLRAEGDNPKDAANREGTSEMDLDEVDVVLADSPFDDETNREEPAAGDSDPVFPGKTEIPEVICLGHDSLDKVDDSSGETRVLDSSAGSKAEAPTSGRGSKQTPDTNGREIKEMSSGRELKKKLVQYSTLLSISSDYAGITNTLKLLDMFLLTTIAQMGVMSAAFYELQGGKLVAIAAKGIELEKCTPLDIKDTLVNGIKVEELDDIAEVTASIIEKSSQEEVLSLGFSRVAPFVIYGDLRGLVLLGKPIKMSSEDDSRDVLKIMIHQAAVAYENTRRFDEERERTLGIVQTLISLIEENTLARGNTALIANYSYIMAKKLHYPEELIRDLLYGVMMRDIGMIKVSDLIVRSPRELVKEEWEIIKRHPIDGAEMLKEMKFSDHAVEIVLCHHEQYNGEGYPNKLRDSQIPRGARIVAIVESYGAMLQDRPTRPALTREEALNTLKENWGMRYDPDMVKQFIEIVEEEIRSGEQKLFTSSELLRI